MAERFNAAVLKTVVGAIPPRVRISAFPPTIKDALRGVFFVDKLSRDENSGKRVRRGGAGRREYAGQL